MLVVQAAGTITPVGLSLVDTMAAIYTGVQLFEDLSILDDDGEPLSGMKVRLESDLLDALEACVDGRLCQAELRRRGRSPCRLACQPLRQPSP